MIGIALAGVLALAGGCGGDGGRLSAREYVEQSSAVFVRGNRSIARVHAGNLHDPTRVARVTVRIVAIHRMSVDELRSLRPPKQYESMARVWIALVDQSLDELDAMRASLRADDRAAAAEYAHNATVLDRRARDVAERSGITACAIPALTV